MAGTSSARSTTTTASCTGCAILNGSGRSGRSSGSGSRGGQATHLLANSSGALRYSRACILRVLGAGLRGVHLRARGVIHTILNRATVNRVVRSGLNRLMVCAGIRALVGTYVGTMIHAYVRLMVCADVRSVICPHIRFMVANVRLIVVIRLMIHMRLMVDRVIRLAKNGRGILVNRGMHTTGRTMMGRMAMSILGRSRYAMNVRRVMQGTMIPRRGSPIRHITQSR